MNSIDTAEKTVTDTKGWGERGKGCVEGSVIQVESFHHQREREREFVWEFKRWLKSCYVKKGGTKWKDERSEWMTVVVGQVYIEVSEKVTKKCWNAIGMEKKDKGIIVTGGMVCSLCVYTDLLFWKEDQKKLFFFIPCAWIRFVVVVFGYETECMDGMEWIEQALVLRGMFLSLSLSQYSTCSNFRLKRPSPF